MTDTTSGNIVPATERSRKSKGLAEKRKSAQEKGVTIVEGGFIAVKNNSLSVYVWDGAEWTVRLRGTITEDFLEKT